jgi:hypothetical protein
LALVVASVSASAADDVAAGRPRVGEVRAFAVAPSNKEAVAELHHDGWLEARGQLLSVSEFPALFKAVGRTWTNSDVGPERFAIPEVLDRSQRKVSSDNPYGVLGPGDLVTGGRVLKGWLRESPLS